MAGRNHHIVSLVVAMGLARAADFKIPPPSVDATVFCVWVFRAAGIMQFYFCSAQTLPNSTQHDLTEPHGTARVEIGNYL